MADSPLNNVNYGRPGLSTYDLDDREWDVSRSPPADTLKQVAEWQLAIPGTLRTLRPRTSTNSTDTRKNVRHLTHDHHQLTPAATHLPALSIVSEAVTSAATAYDPQVGDLLAFGTVFLKKSFRPKRIAALPTGPSGNILRLVPLGKQRQGWNGDKSVWLSGPSFRIVDSAYWNEVAAPIQQVCFAHTESSNGFLAVRLPSKTVLLRPCYHRGRRAAERSPHYDLPPSLLSVRPIVNITLEQTGGVLHADVAFNPEYQFQFGIIDQHSGWSIWQIERRVKKDEYSVLRMVTGDVSLEKDDVIAGDGWARISWAGDSKTLIVCNRRHLSVISLEGTTFEYLQAPPLVSQWSTDWIVDIRKHPHHQSRFFVLTSTRLFLVAVATSSAAVDSTIGTAGATILFCRRHYRGEDDLSLHMDIQATQTTIYMFLASRSNKLVQVYEFHDQSAMTPKHVVSADPMALAFQTPGCADLLQVCVQPLEYGTKVVPQHRQTNPAAQSYFQKSTPFYQLTVILADLSVYQTVVLSSIHDSDPEPLVWRRVVVAKSSLDDTGDIDNMNDFVEPNGPNWDAEPELRDHSQKPRLTSLLDRSSPLITSEQVSMYEALLNDNQSSGDSASLEVLLRQMQDLVIEGPIDGNSRYIMDLVENIDLSDVDEASTKVGQLFEDSNSQNAYLLESIAPLSVLRLPEIEQPSIANLYDTILQEWIAPLPAEVSIAVRQVKERLSRRVAAEVILSSARLRAKNEESTSGFSGDAVSLPILPSKPAEVLPSTLPTPPQSSVPPSSPLFPATGTLPAADPLSRLRRYLSINNDTPTTPKTLPPSVSELLSHWHPGSDPGKYDWEATERALRPETLDAEDQETRERARKRREKREKRQKREDELIRAKSQTSSQAMFTQPMVPRSSPGPSFGGMAASSQAPFPTSSQGPSHVYSQRVNSGAFGGFGGFAGANSMLPQSQVEPGRFGGRPDKKKKKGKNRTYFDAHNAAHSINVLLVGNYHTRQRGPVVWAQATATYVRYFRSKLDDSIISPIAEGAVNRVYYNMPYSAIIGRQEGRSATSGRKAGHRIVETIINVLFLLANQVEIVNNPEKIDMLSNFRLVCKSCEPAPEVRGIASTAFDQGVILETEIERTTKKRKRASNGQGHDERIKPEDDLNDEVAAPPKPQLRDRTIECPSSNSPLPYRPGSKSPQASLVNQLLQYEADMESKLEGQKQAHTEETERIQARLDQQLLRAQAAEEKSMKERKKRKRAEEEVESPKGQVVPVSEGPVESEVQEIAARSIQLGRMEREIAGLRRILEMRDGEITRMKRVLEARDHTIKELKEQLTKK